MSKEIVYLKSLMMSWSDWASTEDVLQCDWWGGGKIFAAALMPLACSKGTSCFSQLLGILVCV